MSLRTTPEQRARVIEVLGLLGRRYPYLFPAYGSPVRPPPLAIGISKAVAAALDDEVSEGELKQAFRAWCGSPRYLKALTAPGAMRHNLAGEAVEPVHGEAAERAAARLAALNARRFNPTGKAEPASPAKVSVTGPTHPVACATADPPPVTRAADAPGA